MNSSLTRLLGSFATLLIASCGGGGGGGGTTPPPVLDLVAAVTAPA